MRTARSLISVARRAGSPAVQCVPGSDTCAVADIPPLCGRRSERVNGLRQSIAAGLARGWPQLSVQTGAGPTLASNSAGFAAPTEANHSRNQQLANDGCA